MYIVLTFDSEGRMKHVRKYAYTHTMRQELNETMEKHPDWVNVILKDVATTIYQGGTQLPMF